MERLTARQQQIFNLIRDNLDETGYPPTRAEIAQQLGFKSANAAEDHLRALARKGVIEMIPGASRGIRIVEHHVGIPIIGRVAAGEPILAEQNIEDYQEVPSSTFHPHADYFLRVQGQSMIDVGIMDGDLLAVHQQPTAENQQIIVARVDGEVTVKRLKRTRSKHEIQLLPENRDYSPIVVDLRAQEFAIEGLAVGVVRVSM
ncbi:MAG: transcriptional repressor LexA [Porticoccaceae bacterium]|jgi:repressor LexA|nr:MAG: LexA repressor [SAR92 bacterium BACL16 MAG-120619-bin48]MDO7635390.1 transcriptional repressor LexA [Porticoccaceae bacterium]MDP4655460.1 transcriptional repressor LexA [Alphaproteobacteria bacterium]MDP4744570.1 transcriptional repressor LexA [Porticoccaceae bacterium]MDP4753837.1 transcriptional repressor LexA [Porticoccaceae bacterium]|tara:strand:+ start:4618 stop:5223 length:606 start_codon:yes stop_codon:yes gene_type:complete